MKNLLVTIVLALSAAGLTLAQEEDVKAKHEAYYRCINNIEADPHKAYGFCSEYLKTYPNDDRRLTEFAGLFVRAYDKIAVYMKSSREGGFVDKTPKWAVYKPDRRLITMTGTDTEGQFTFTVTRKFSPEDEQLLDKAESLYKNPETVETDLLGRWRDIGNSYFVLPADEPFWWSISSDGILSTEVVTGEAVRYYLRTIALLKINDGRVKDGSTQYISASLKYESSIEKRQYFERSGKTFTNVYVANMILTWRQVCGMRCGRGFTRNKLIVMNEKGEILEMFLDDKVNNMGWVS